MTGLERAAVAPAVEAHLTGALGRPTGRASVTFLGAEPLTVLRFGPDGRGLRRYATVGASAAPMADPTSLAADPVRGPRAELVLSARAPVDSVLRALAAMCAAPAVDGLVLTPGACLELGEPLWEGAAFTAVLLAAPDALVPDLVLPEPADPVRFLPVLPLTAAEAAWKRAHGAAALQALWLTEGTDLHDPGRVCVALRRPA